MFQPHSVRGLLSRRNVSRIQEDPADLQSNGDPDLESMVEAKLFIKGGTCLTQTSTIKLKTSDNGAITNALFSYNNLLLTRQSQTPSFTLISATLNSKSKEMYRNK